MLLKSLISKTMGGGFQCQKLNIVGIAAQKMIRILSTAEVAEDF